MKLPFFLETSGVEQDWTSMNGKTLMDFGDDFKTRKDEKKPKLMRGYMKRFFGVFLCIHKWILFGFILWKIYMKTYVE